MFFLAVGGTISRIGTSGPDIMGRYLVRYEAVGANHLIYVPVVKNKRVLLYVMLQHSIDLIGRYITSLHIP